MSDSLTPAMAGEGAEVTITGKNLLGYHLSLSLAVLKPHLLRSTNFQRP